MEWIKPIVHSVALPAHAATSPCQTQHLVGIWRFISATHFVPAYYPQLELYQDGSTSDFNSEWAVIDNTFVLRQDVSDFIFRAPITLNCNLLNGTSTTAFTFPPYNLPANGTWSAEKI